MTEILTFQRTLRLHLGQERAEWLRHETVTRFADGQEAVVSMEFEQVAPDVAMQYPPAQRWCDEQAEYNAGYQRERKQGLNRERTPRPERKPRYKPAPRPKPQPRWMTELAPGPETQPPPEPDVVPEAPRRGKAQIRPFDWTQYENETDGKL